MIPVVLKYERKANEGYMSDIMSTSCRSAVPRISCELVLYLASTPPSLYIFTLKTCSGEKAWTLTYRRVVYNYQNVCVLRQLVQYRREVGQFHLERMELLSCARAGLLECLNKL